MDWWAKCRMVDRKGDKRRRELNWVDWVRLLEEWMVVSLGEGL